jgi:hypothetical protein
MIAPARGRATLIVLALLGLLAGSACSGDGGGARAETAAESGDGVITGDSTSTSQRPASPDLPGTGDETPAGQGPFCDSIAAIQGLGGGEARTATPEQVLAQNEQMLDLLDEAAASVPEGAPADVESLFDDYRRIAEAIGEAGGDTDAAYTTIEAADPALAARLFNPTAHLPAFEFFARDCGISFQ